jgi:glucose dehydrogenase
LLLVAYALDRRQPQGADYAAWVYAVALIASAVGLADVLRGSDAARHTLAPIALLLMAAALYLRRRSVLAAGLVAALVYVGWLTFTVFRQVLDFPIVLATFGLIVLIGTVWLQRRFPSLVERVSGDGARRRDLIPGGWFAAAGPVVIACALLASEVPAVREEARDRAFRDRVFLKRQARIERTLRREGKARAGPIRPPVGNRR